MNEPVVLFFDGVCGLCNGVIDFVMRFDKQKKIQFSPLQSDYAKSKLPVEFTQSLSTLVVLKQNQIFTQSEAVFLIAQQLGGIFRLLLIFKLLPSSLRNQIYGWISDSRYQIFGKKDSCRLPTPSEKSRFLL
jgi:predicted DCC family thiol-disulfide oxidoreductase YuxK